MSRSNILEGAATLVVPTANVDLELQDRQASRQDSQSVNLPNVSTDAYPEGGLAAWLVVAASFAMILATYGVMSCVGVFQAYWQTHQLATFTPSDVAWIPSVFLFLNLLTGIQVGPLLDRYGTRWITLIGSIGYVMSIVLLGSCHKYWQFLLCMGVLGGVSSAMITTTCFVAISHWFRRRRGMVTGLALMGSSVGGIVFPIILRATFDRFGWAWAIRLLGLIVLILLGVGNIWIKGRLPTKSQRGAITLQCFTDARFVWLTLGVCCIELTYFAALGLIPSYALAQGFSTNSSFYLISALNAGSTMGRWLPGFMSDRYGRFNTMTVTISLTIVFMFVIWFPFGHFKSALYVFVPLFGFGTGSFVSLAPVCVGQICETEEYGRWFGSCYCIVSFATLISIPIGGQLLKAVGAKSLVAFLGGVLSLGLMSFLMARWACLDYHWRWRVKV